ncbi:MAG TPA: hypothetical protein VFQ24_09650 [Terriglobia bacterium]|nr:hypothetical protein [Terriglobia bacterium]
MRVKLLLVAEIEVMDGSDPESAALSRIQGLGHSADIEFYPPAIGRSIETGGSRSVEVFY